MITVSDVSVSFGGQLLFKDVDLKFTAGNCYGVIGANGAGKSTFLKVLCGDLEPTKGSVSKPSVLRQDHYAFDDYTVQDTVILGNKRLYDIMQEKDALYAKEDFSEEDGTRASELEAEFAELNGWEAESDASKLIQGLGLPEEILYQKMDSLTGNEKVKVLLAQCLFGNPDIILMDEPTNHLDVEAVSWLEDFLAEYFGTVIVVSHDRHFLNNVCTHIVDIDYGKIKMYVGNYEFWYESSQLIQRMIKQQNKRAEEKIKELQNFIARFSANKSKSKQATSRRKLIDKLTVEELPASSRKYPYIAFDMEREVGKDILQVTGLSKTVDGVKVLNNVSFTVGKGDKIAFVGNNEIAVTTLFKILMEEMEPDEGTFKWGSTTSVSYFPNDNSAFFDNCQLSIIDWMRQYSKDETESYLRGFLGRMLFSGDDVFKQVNVLSGGERNRLNLALTLKQGGNLLLLDEPTNDLDVETLSSLEAALLEFPGCSVVISHDRMFLDRVATHILAWEGTDENPGNWYWFEGNFEAYQANRIERLGEDAAQPHRIHRKLTRD